MKLFKNDILASAYDLKSYNEGVKLYAGDNIKMLKIDDGSFLGYHLIEGIVNGDGHDIKVILGVSKTGKIYFGNCSCKKGQVCKHGIAILEKIKKIEINKLPYVYIAKDMVNKIEINKDVPEDLKRQLIAQKFATNKTHQFIKKYKNKVVNEVNYLKDGTKYQITTNLECEMGKYLLRFKVGDNYKYVIKDIELFLATIDSNSWCEYGKNLGFYHCKEAFSEETLKIIDLMRYACQNQKRAAMIHNKLIVFI